MITKAEFYFSEELLPEDEAKQIKEAVFNSESLIKRVVAKKIGGTATSFDVALLDRQLDMDELAEDKGLNILWSKTGITEVDETVEIPFANRDDYTKKQERWRHRLHCYVKANGGSAEVRVMADGTW